jgi:hypothetical protein
LVTIIITPVKEAAESIKSTPQDQKFTIHKCFLCDQSPFFFADFKDESFLGGKTQSVLLEGVDADVFDLLVG